MPERIRDLSDEYLMILTSFNLNEENIGMVAVGALDYGAPEAIKESDEDKDT